jgi:hypothetical protein
MTNSNSNLSKETWAAIDYFEAVNDDIAQAETERLAAQQAETEASYRLSNRKLAVGAVIGVLGVIAAFSIGGDRSEEAQHPSKKHRLSHSDVIRAVQKYEQAVQK